jgi:ABC-type nitrate/sulfonate/bicarbonate transport system permease component
MKALRLSTNLLLSVILGASMLLVLWTLLAEYVHTLDNEIAREVVPYPEQVWDVLQEERVQEALELNFRASTRRVLRGIIYATVLAYPLGVILGQSRFLNRLFSPVLNLVYPIPKVVFLPVVIILFGTSDGSKVALITLILFFQILVIVRDEALDIPPDLIESVRSLGAGRRALFVFVYIPATFGAILTAWRVSVGTAVAVLFIAETTATQEGLGYYIMNRNQRLRYEEMYAGILAMSLLGVGLYAITDILERLFQRWKN